MLIEGVATFVDRRGGGGGGETRGGVRGKDEGGGAGLCDTVSEWTY